MLSVLIDFQRVRLPIALSRQQRRMQMRQASRRSLAQLLRDAGASSDKINRDETGLHPEDSRFFCSVSYCAERFCAAVSNHPIGIDIETLNDRRDWRKIGQFLWRREPDDITDFFYHFGIMEAWGKLMGIGIHSQSRRITTSASQIRSPDYPKSYWNHVSIQTNELNFCLVTPEDAELNATTIDTIRTKLNSL